MYLHANSHEENEKYYNTMEYAIWKELAGIDENNDKVHEIDSLDYGLNIEEKSV